MTSTNLIAISSSVFLLLFVLEVVRRRRLREEYAWLWLVMSGGYFVFAIIPALPKFVAEVIGANRPVEVFDFLGVFFLVLICIQFSMRLSRLTDRNRYLAQHIAILEAEVATIRNAITDTD